MEEKPLIMVVDDEKEFAEEVAATIKETGKYDVIVENSGKEAIETFKKHNGLFSLLKRKIRLIFLDIKMPEMDGLAVLETIRKIYRGDESLGIIMLTAFEDQEKWDKALEGYIAGYIRKPFDRKDLLAKVDRFFSRDQEEPYKMVSDTIVEGLDRMEEMKKKQG